jgi:undecaprenyl-diphosphatase
MLAGLLAVGLVGCSAVLWVLAELHHEIVAGVVMTADMRIQDFVHGLESPALTVVMFALTWIGSPTSQIVLVALIAIALWRRRQMRDEAMLLVGSMIGAEVLDTVLKLHFKRVRPDVPWAFLHEHSFSFPSGHSVMAVVFYGTLLYVGLRHVRATWLRVVLVCAALLLIVGIGTSRIYLGVHYPSDVAAGYFVGSVWLAMVMAAHAYVRRRGAAG